MTSPKLTVVQKAAKSVGNVERTLQSRPIFIILIIATFILYLAVLVFNFLAIYPAFSKGLFTNGLSGIPEEFLLNFTPSGWAVYIWAVIYVLQLTWVLYSLGLVCRSINQEPAYLNPIVLSPAFFIFFNISSAFNIGWLFLWDRMLFLASFVFLACIALSLLLTVSIVSSRLMMLKDTLLDQDRNKELKFLQIVIINSLAMYITWTVMVAVINLGILVVFRWHQPITNEGTSILSVSILSFLSVIYILLDLTVLGRYTKYSVSPYAVVIWMLVASLSQNYNPGNLSSIMSLFLVGAISLAFLFKLGFSFLRSSSIKGQYRLLKMDRSNECIQ